MFAIPSIRTLLVALDTSHAGSELSTGSRLAVEEALSLARALEARVLLLHSTAADERWDEAAGSYLHRPEGSREAREPVLERVAKRFAEAGIVAERRLVQGNPALEIIRCVLRERVDLVVCGKRNEVDRPGHHRLGSVSNKLLRKCPCAVWVVKPGNDPSPRKILAATDLSPVGERVLDHALLLADHYGAELHVVHTFQRPLAVQFEGGAATFEREQRAARRARIAARVGMAKPEGEVHIHVGCDSPSHAILAFEKRHAPDLVVMGTVSRGGIAGLLVGNTAERLLHRLDTSLLAVKPEDFVCPVTLEAAA